MAGKYMQTMTLRHDARKIGMLRDIGVLKYSGASVNLSSGPYKSAISLLPRTAMAKGVAYCFGNKSEIQQLLTEIDHIGKKHHRGCGKVLQWEVESVCESEAENGWRYRNLPIEMQSYKTDDHCMVSNIGIRPPYYKHGRSIGLSIHQ